VSIRQREKVKALDLPPTLKRVLDALADHADDNGENCWPSQERLCWETGFKRTAMINALAELHRRGLAVKQNEVKGRGDSIHYHLFIDKGPFQKSFADFRLAFSRGKKGTQNVPFPEVERVCETDGKGTPGEPGRVCVADERVRETDPNRPHPSVDPPTKPAGGRVIQTLSFPESFYQAAGRTLSMSNSERERLSVLKEEHGDKVLWKCWKLFLIRSAGLDGLARPVAVFLQEFGQYLPIAQKAAVERQ
jgi:hypothetical protein